jgi:hypothetical protein
LGRLHQHQKRNDEKQEKKLLSEKTPRGNQYILMLNFERTAHMKLD